MEDVRNFITHKKIIMYCIGTADQKSNL